MAENVQKKKEEAKNILDTISDLIERGRKAPTKQELEALAALGKVARSKAKPPSEMNAVPELKPSQEAIKEAEKLKKALNEAARHGEVGMLRWA